MLKQMLRQTLTRLGSFIWSLASHFVRAGVSWGWIKPYHLRVRVISVGNIQVGGSGKTPLVAQIANEAHARGLRVAILTRGYKSVWEKTGGVIFPSQHTKDLQKDVTIDPKLCGDEPALLHELAPYAAIAVGANRIRSYMRLVHELRWAVDLVILDDGFQHLKIHRDLDVVALTSKTRRDVLYRDFDSSLNSKSNSIFCVWTKGSNVPSGMMNARSSMRGSFSVFSGGEALVRRKKNLARIRNCRF